jgi:hypothetical protein
MVAEVAGEEEYSAEEEVVVAVLLFSSYLLEMPSPDSCTVAFHVAAMHCRS